MGLFHRAGIRREVKFLTCLRVLGMVASIQDMDEQGRIGRQTTSTYLAHFMKKMLELYATRYLNKRPTPEELESISELYTEVEFLDCVECVDCMKFHWKNWPIDLKGQYHSSRGGKVGTIQDEAWCDRDLYV